MLLRGVQGIASAMLFSTGTAIVALVYPPERRGWAMGMVVSVVYVGLAIGPVVGGFLNYRFGWQSIFYFIGLLGALAAVMTILFMKEEWVNREQGHLGFVSILLYAISLIAGLYGLSEIVNAWWGPYLLGVGIVFALLFVIHEAKVTKPLLPVLIF